MKKSLLTLFALLCIVVQGLSAQEPTPSTALEPYITTLGNRMVYKFNYPSTSATGDPYEDMHHALVSNNVCTGWEPQHRIQFAHSKGDMIVPYSNYLAFCDAHPDGEDDMYRIDNTFSDSDHLNSGTKFLIGLGTDFFDYFQWIDEATPTGIKTMTDVKVPMPDVWYTIDGRRILSPLTTRHSPLKRGLYIVRGTKVAIAAYGLNNK